MANGWRHRASIFEHSQHRYRGTRHFPSPSCSFFFSFFFSGYFAVLFDESLTRELFMTRRRWIIRNIINVSVSLNFSEIKSMCEWWTILEIFNSGNIKNWNRLKRTANTTRMQHWFSISRTHPSFLHLRYFSGIFDTWSSIYMIWIYTAREYIFLEFLKVTIWQSIRKFIVCVLYKWFSKR